MSPLFGNKAEKVAEEAAAAAECDRLLALPRPQLAVAQHVAAPSSA